MIVLTGAVLAASMTGCYKRVTRASGIGSDETAPEIHKRQTTFTEDLRDAVRGDDKKKRN